MYNMPALQVIYVLAPEHQKEPTSTNLPFCSGTSRSDRWQSDGVLPDDSELRSSSRPMPAWYSPSRSRSINTSSPLYQYPGPPPSPWSSPSPPRSWDHDTRSGARHMRVEPYSTPLCFNMGYAQDKRQRADRTFKKRLSRWSSPRGHVTSPTRQSPRSYLPGRSGGMSGPTGSLPSPSRMSSPTRNTMKSRGFHGGPGDRSLGPRDRSPSPRDRSPSPKDRSPTPRDRSLSSMDCSPSPRGNLCDIKGHHKDNVGEFAGEDEQLHTARVAANRPLGASPSPECGSPTCSDLLAQKCPRGPDSRLLNFCQPANASPDISRPMASSSAASCLSHSHLAEGALQQGSHCPVHDPQQPSQHAANGPKAEQVKMQLQSTVARHWLDLSDADKTSQMTAPTDSSDTDCNFTAALGQTHFKDPLTLADLHAVVPDASNLPVTHMQDMTDAAVTTCQRQKQGGKSLLKKVLRKSLAKQDGECIGLSGSDASCNSSQDVIHTCSESASDAQTFPAKAADIQQPQHVEHADVKKSKRVKRPRPADSEADPSKQALEADAQTRLQAERTKHKSKRRRRSLGEPSCHTVWPRII